MYRCARKPEVGLYRGKGGSKTGGTVIQEGKGHENRRCCWRGGEGF